jgi:hypothetical protein
MLQAMTQLSPEQAELLSDEASRGAFERAEAQEGVAAFLQRRPADWIPAQG